MARLPWENEIQELRPPDDVADITGHKGLYGFLSPEMLSRNDPVQRSIIDAGIQEVASVIERQEFTWWLHLLVNM